MCKRVMRECKGQKRIRETNTRHAVEISTEYTVFKKKQMYFKTERKGVRVKLCGAS